MDQQFGGLYPGLIAEVLSFFGHAKQIVSKMSNVCRRFRSATFQMRDLTVQHRDEETSDAAVQYIARNRSLSHLKIMSSTFTGKQIVQMLRSTQVPSISIEHLSEIGHTVDFSCVLAADEPLQLTELRLHDVAVNSCAQLLCKCPHLHCLEVVRCDDFADGDVDGIVAAMLHQSEEAASSTASGSGGSALPATVFLSAADMLTRLTLSHLVRLHDRGLAVLAQALPHSKVQHLSLAGCRTISNVGVQQIVAACPPLLSLDLTSIPCLSDQHIAPAVLLHRGIQHLALPPSTGSSTFRAMAQVAAEETSFQALKTLILRQCTGVQGSSLAELLDLLRILPALVRLDMSWCTGLTDFTVHDIAAAAPGLQELVLDKCPRLSDSGADAALRRLPRLRLLSAKGSGVTQASVDAAKMYRGSAEGSDTQCRVLL